MELSPKIRPEHLERLAGVYVRQSTMRQVRENTASTAMQYDFAERAVALGWRRDRVRYYDADLGVTGAVPDAREEFRQLAADVGMRRVGIVLSFDVTRMSRNNADWYQLLDLCSICDTLIADSDGVYHPALYNDRLVLGLKGTMSEAEMHFRRARMQGAIEKRASEGTLRKRLPVGLEYAEDGSVRLAADESVRRAIDLVFTRFAQYGSAHRVFRYLQAEGLLLPARRNDEQQTTWVKPRYGAILGILTNPRYAGAYVYGRRTRRRSVDSGGRIQVRVEALPRDQWKVLLKDQHPAYITWDVFLDNQRRLDENALAVSPGEASTVVREGRGLLAGLLRCGVCGRRMSPCYPSKGDRVRYICDRVNRNHGGDGVCQSIGGTRIQKAVVDAFLDALSPASMQVTIAALEQMDAEGDAVLRQLEDRRERCQYEADRARRQYDAVDPENRLVARTLEQDWNRRLQDQAEVERQIESRRHQQPPPLTADERGRLRELGLDLRRVWDAASTLPQERKRLLRAAFSDVFVRVDREQQVAHLTLAWQGGATDEVSVSIPATGERANLDANAVIEEVRKMAASLTDAQIAQTLVRRGIRTATGLPFNIERVHGLRKRHGIPEFEPDAAAGSEPTVTAEQAAAILGVSGMTVLRWLADGFLQGEQVSPRAPWRIRQSSLKALRTARKAPDGWLPPKEAAAAFGVPRETVIHWARTGEVESMMAGTGRRRGLRINVASRTCTAQLSF